MVTFSRRMAGEAGIFLALMIIGIDLGNTTLIYLALVPFFFIIFSMAYRGPVDIRVLRADKVIMAHRNEAVRITLTVNTDSGTGIVVIADPLPEHFGLASGNNIRVYWNKGRALSFEQSYEIKCAKRGIYNIGPAQSECFHHSWMEQTTFVRNEAVTRLIVEPMQQNIKKMRDQRLHSSIPMPIGSVSRLGVRTTDFTEIRCYYPGDSYRAINWKATARHSMAIDAKPYVNEYEKEGKKTVFIFVDAGAWMGIGTTVDNLFEYAVQAASGIAAYYLERNMRVGVYVYNYGKLIVPDTGRKQASTILRSLLDVQVDARPDEGDDGLTKAIKECSGHLVGVNPLFIVITMAGKKNTRDIIEGIKSMRKYSSKARIPPVTVIHLAGYSLIASGQHEEVGATLLEIDQMRYIRAIKKTGVFIVPWNPKTKSLSHLMMAGFRRR